MSTMIIETNQKCYYYEKDGKEYEIVEMAKDHIKCKDENGVEFVVLL